jgi:hypothetical protein
MVKAEH